MRLTTEYQFENRAILIVPIFGHELFHFCGRQNKDRENEADQFALSVEDAFRKGRNFF
jgi:hypothetical protein